MSDDRESWVAIENDFPDHPKLVHVGPLGGWAHLSAICYCDRFRTNGFLPESIAWRILHQDSWMDEQTDLLEQLLEANLWERTEGGYLVHDYLKYQRDADEIRDLRKVRQEAGRKGGLASGEARRSKAEANASKPEAETDKEKELSSSSTSREDRNDLPLEQEHAAAALLAAIGATNGTTREALDRYELPPAAWYAAAEELEHKAGIRNRAGYVVTMFRTWKQEGRYS